MPYLVGEASRDGKSRRAGSCGHIRKKCIALDLGYFDCSGDLAQAIDDALHYLGPSGDALTPAPA